MIRSVYEEAVKKILGPEFDVMSVFYSGESSGEKQYETDIAYQFQFMRRSAWRHLDWRGLSIEVVSKLHEQIGLPVLVALMHWEEGGYTPVLLRQSEDWGELTEFRLEVYTPPWRA